MRVQKSALGRLKTEDTERAPGVLRHAQAPTIIYYAVAESSESAMRNAVHLALSRENLLATVE